ncbi:MAG: zinc-ribbon domain-containing protein [Pseudodesulfovibrio sp.]|uniref:MJ0042 family finger-like protein n=1 Tax=Pseudodesulfovibrio aespoeensis (strain ATCC 700646 / DSM 10631 / Aspo-2) TaxID=643562 RepID=E6VR36_PSEA9|nr:MULTISPECIES: DUF3426 domain-containing protein [Pseudodesulfovibrio]MBU4245135.1 zinc-ribbon domain-containing protein [Pseudomonadota bacterium]ADU64120.1 MJ0042 family finger-like protein [Pseudodesulfovibrio aespoeensis Aspo-2]MBU4380267.1 zinc-ribbon domain-containing protein [Pseudomonadota bacterium]MBU4474488.1 zinc-ribbon domain-containing protein [Pseudomonadota bacterium]MBU4517644.1 zinc-ribbon domain-containing protein [Pseudomonadota bacterium]
MIVTCPNCQTRYNLPDAKVPAKGAKVKCSKCTHVFKTPAPKASPEEEVEGLFEEEAVASGTKARAGDEFDETFDEVASATRGAKKAAPPKAAPAKAAAKARTVAQPDEFPETDAGEEEAGFGDAADMDDLFDEAGGADSDDGPDSAGVADEDALFDDSDDDSDSGGESDEDAGLFDDDAPTGSDDDLFADDGEDAAQGDEEEEDGEEYEEDEEEEDDASGFGLDDRPARKSRRSFGCLIVILILALGIGAGVYFKVWTLLGIDLASYFQNVPYVGRLFMDGGADTAAAPGESPADRVRKIELRNVKQYYVANEKTGNLFVVEGKAVNAFATPKERVRIEVVLYDAAGTVLTSQALLCGNVLSQFQLQVQTQKEIEDGLSSEVGILSNNTFIRPGSSTPFMAVFFQPPPTVKEFLVKVVDVGDPS